MDISSNGSVAGFAAVAWLVEAAVWEAGWLAQPALIASNEQSNRRNGIFMRGSVLLKQSPYHYPAV